MARRKVGESFCHFWINSVDKNEKGRQRGRKQIERGKRKPREREREIFPAFQWSKLDGPGIKVGPLNESYAWVPKSVSFVKLQKVGNFPTRVISSLKAI